MQIRRSGILLHITSLPSPYGIGDLGEEAYHFADFLFKSRQTAWQVLPLVPFANGCGNSPYCGISAFAGNPLLLSPVLLAEEGLLLRSEIEDPPSFPQERVDYEMAARYKYGLLQAAGNRCRRNSRKQGEFESFCQENAHWLEDYALFVALKANLGGPQWFDWPMELRDRSETALRACRSRLKNEIHAEKFIQYLFFKQWGALKHYCNDKQIQIIGDMPIYVNYDSADVWANPQMFKLDERKRPAFVAGVPPDYFSSTGQLWGNPVYQWDKMKELRYSWWINRLERSLKLFDMIRLDHFRGLVEYWEVPASEKTALNGKWVEVPAKDFFDTLLRRFPSLSIIAEDLGIITPDIREVMRSYNFPGMKVLQFAFGDDSCSNPYVPHNHIRNCVVYTGTHDNNTTRGWFKREASPEDKRRLFKYVGRTIEENEIHWEFVQMAMRSVSNMAIIPMQDILGLGEEARMNLPAVEQGNWEWRLAPGAISPELSSKLAEVTHIYGRG